MNDQQAAKIPEPAKEEPEPATDWRRNVLGWGALAAVASAALAIAANLSEIAGWFAPDETRELVEETRDVMQGTDQKIEELLVLLRNQAAVSGLDLSIQSETAIRNAVQAIVVSGNTQKQAALAQLDDGDITGAADMMTRVARSQAAAVSDTSEAAAATWREAGALYFSFNMERAVESYRTALDLVPDHIPTMDMLGYALIRAGRLDEAEEMFEAILSLDTPALNSADAFAGLGFIARQRGNYDAAEQHYQAGLRVLDGEPRSAQHADALAAVGHLEIARGNLRSAATWLRRALDTAQEIAHDKLRATALSGLATVAAREQRFDDAERMLQETLEIYESKNDLAGRTLALGNLGAVALSRGDTDTAEERISESAALSEQLGWRASLAYDLVNLAAIASSRGDFETADQRLSRAQGIAADVGLNELLPVIVFNRGDIARDAGDVAAACKYWLSALPMLTAMGSAHVAEAEAAIEAANCEAADSPP